jgi:hypothetical protein
MQLVVLVVEEVLGLKVEGMGMGMGMVWLKPHQQYHSRLHTAVVGMIHHHQRHRQLPTQPSLKLFTCCALHGQQPWYAGQHLHRWTPKTKHLLPSPRLIHGSSFLDVQPVQEQEQEQEQVLALLLKCLHPRMWMMPWLIRMLRWQPEQLLPLHCSQPVWKAAARSL